MSYDYSTRKITGIQVSNIARMMDGSEKALMGDVTFALDDRLGHKRGPICTVSAVIPEEDGDTIAKIEARFAQAAIKILERLGGATPNEMIDGLVEGRMDNGNSAADAPDTELSSS
jgi:hypothetical protein